MATGIESFFPLVIASAGAAAVSIFGFRLSRKMGLTPQQAKYVEQLEGMTSQYKDEISFLRGRVDDKETEIKELSEEGLKKDGIIATRDAAIASQNHEIDDLKQEIFELRTSKMVTKRPRRTPPAAPR